MKTVLIVQARLQSQRFPGKVLAPVRGRALLSYQLERLRRVQEVDEFIVAIPDHPSEDPLAACCVGEHLSVFRGSNEDVLERLYQAASQYSADCVVRVRGDSPFIDPDLVSQMIRRFHQLSPGVDYLSNLIKRTYPHGMDIEIFTMALLETLHQRVNTPFERECITPYILTRLHAFKTQSMTAETDLSFLRWHTSTPAHFEQLEKVLEACYFQNPVFTFSDVFTAWNQLFPNQPVALPYGVPLKKAVASK